VKPNGPPPRDELRRLHFINALFSQVTGHDLYLAHQIRTAIAFSLGELEQQAAEHPEFAAKFDAAFNAAAARLLEKFCAHSPAHGFFHWDAARTLHSATPLFARAEIMAGLKQLAAYRESTLLVTNLRPAVLPPDRRATPRRKQEYDEILNFIRELAAARATRHSDLQILFL
jgi:hypothetical protein